MGGDLVSTTSREGLTIHYDDGGSGPCIVLGHSFLCSGEMWRHQIDVLRRNRRVLNVDFRGHGRSSPAVGEFSLYDLVDDVIAVLDHAEVDQAMWAGLSVGGMVAMRAALTARKRVSGLILIDTHAGAEKRAKALKYRAMGLGAKLVGMKPFLPSIVPLMFGNTSRRENDQLVAEWKERILELDIPSIRAFLRSLNSRDDVTDRLRDIDVPTLVIVGEEDRSLPPRCSERIASAIPGARLEVIQGAGHLSALERPEAVNRAILEFLEVA